MDQEWPKADNFVSRHDIAPSQLDIDRSDGAHCIKSPSFELEQCASISSSALCENADWIILLVINFDCTLPVGDLLHDVVTGRLVRASVNEEALEAATRCAEQGRILVVNGWGEARMQR